MYMSPQMATGNYSFDVDLWSLGITIWELATLEYPYKDSLNGHGLENHLNLEMATLDKIHVKLPEGYSENCKNFITECLGWGDGMPHVKTTAGRLLEHEWIKDNIISIEEEGHKFAEWMQCNHLIREGKSFLSPTF
jgi:serine/threonine protein kinase